MKYLWMGLLVWITMLPFGLHAKTPLPIPPVPIPVEQQTEAVITPDILDLKPNWWKYFQVESEEQLEERIERFQFQLDQQKIAINQQEQKAANNFIKRIKANLEALPALRANTSADTPTPVPVLEKYTTGQLLKLTKQLWDHKIELDADEAEQTRLRSSIKAAQKLRDNLMAAYLKTPHQTPKKLLRGLEISANQTVLSIALEHLRLHQARLKISQTVASRLDETLKIAQQRLFATEAGLMQLESEIQKLESQQQILYRKLLSAENSILEDITTDGPAGKAMSHWLGQKAVHVAGRELHARLRILVKKQEKYLAEFLLTGLPHASIQEEEKTWSLLMEETDNQVSAWKESTERELARSNTALLSLDTETMNPMLEAMHHKRIQEAQETLLLFRRLENTRQTGELWINILHEKIAAQQGELYLWWNTTGKTFTNTYEIVQDWSGKSLFTIGENPVTPYDLLWFVLIILVAVWASKLIRFFLDRISQNKKGVQKSSIYVTGRLLHYTILTIGVLIGISSIGIDITKLALVAGALSIGIGFGLQSIFNNFVSGLILLFEKPLKIGDFVELESGVRGEVREINVRSTRITTRDNLDILVPNSEFINGRVVNWTLEDPSRRVHILFGVSYDSNKEIVRDAILEAAQNVEYTLKTQKTRQPQVWLDGFGESRILFKLVVWIRPNVAKLDQEIEAAYLWEIESILRKYNLKVPFPQRDLHIKSVFQHSSFDLPESKSPESP
ncbi:MAG: mechanosensitive ion channel [SAR324 cluster bacterium]|nr:mechanosensitive ion channel [SAR324 cluster bacterium]